MNDYEKARQDFKNASKTADKCLKWSMVFLGIALFCFTMKLIGQIWGLFR